MTRFIMLCTGLLVGCTPKHHIEALSIASPSEASICPGESLALVVEATSRHALSLSTRSHGRHHLGWDELVMTLDGAPLEAGALSLPADPLETVGRELLLSVAVAEAPAVSASMVIHPRYDCDYVADLSGMEGRPGTPGIPGTHGHREHRGGDGQAGLDGGPGGAGGTVQAHASLISHPDGQPLLKVVVTGTQRTAGGDLPFERTYLIDEAGSLSIDASGGAGGAGGEGGHGGGGGNSERPNGIGDGGDGGNGGNGGNGGDGGLIVLQLTEAASAWLDHIHYTNTSGPGGAPGVGGAGGGHGQYRPPPSTNSTNTSNVASDYASPTYSGDSWGGALSPVAEGSVMNGIGADGATGRPGARGSAGPHVDVQIIAAPAEGDAPSP